MKKFLNITFKLVIAFLVALLLALVLSCKKQTIKQTEDKKIQKFSISVNKTIPGSYVKLNGSIITPPFNVVSGDVVGVCYYGTLSTPPTYDLYIKVYLDSKVIGECNGCTEYKTQIKI